jgi:hypothetical protein
VGGIGVYTGLSALDTGYGTIEWANTRDEEIWIHTTVTSSGGLLSSPEVAYESEYRIFPTDHYRTADTNAVKTDTYQVEIEVESEDGSMDAGPFTTTWAPVNCYHQRLIIRVLRDLSVEFEQKEC